MKKFKKSLVKLKGVTLVELIVVVLILTILATIATGVYIGQADKARIAGTKDLIRQLELGIGRYEVDLGLLPPSGSGASPVRNVLTLEDGSGYLYFALMHSMSGTAYTPASPLWDGPYVTIQQDQLAPATTANQNNPTGYNILDAWGNPMLYVNTHEYQLTAPNFSGGSRLYPSTAPGNANPTIPAPNPFIAFGETYYNPTTYQLISFGPNGNTIGRVSSTSSIAENYAGTENDDVNNFGF